MLVTDSRTKQEICEQIAAEIMGGYRGEVTLPSGTRMKVDNLMVGSISVMPAMPLTRWDNGQDILGAMAYLDEPRHIVKQVKLIFGRLEAELARRKVEDK